MMNLKALKKNVSDFLIAKGFSKRGMFFYLFFQDIKIVIGLQKSNFSNTICINIGYLISEINPSLLFPRDADGDVRARFSIVQEGKRIDFFDLDIISEENLTAYLEENIKKYVYEINSIKKLRFLLQENPVLAYQVKIAAKQLLQID